MERSNEQLRTYYFSASDSKFFKIEENVKRVRQLSTYEYKKPKLYFDPVSFEKNGLPIAFKTTPEPLLQLTSKVVDKLPLPEVYTWNIEDVCRWLRTFGYPQYQHTFRENLINGRTLLLLDASALSNMNIKCFNDIRHIAYGIRCLFHFEMTKFSRSLSLAPNFHEELYKLLRVKNGTKYEKSKKTDLWRKMQLMRETTLKDYSIHWDILERWLNFDTDPRSCELIGGVRRSQLYKCKSAFKTKLADQDMEYVVCTCYPPCECFWTQKEMRNPWVLNLIGSSSKQFVLKRTSVLTVLNASYPERYKPFNVRKSRFH